MSVESKQTKYEYLLQQLQGISESDVIANMANASALLYSEFKFWWVGFYRVVNEELVLGPFQGPVACTRIAKGRGVCGTAWQEKRTLIVPNVEQFAGHIACSSYSKSEIVVPVIKNEAVKAVLDIDSEYLNHFDNTDAEYLQKVALLIAKYMK